MVFRFAWERGGFGGPLERARGAEHRVGTARLRRQGQDAGVKPALQEQTQDPHAKLLGMIVILAVAVFGFHASRAGKPIFAGKALEL